MHCESPFPGCDKVGWVEALRSDRSVPLLVHDKEGTQPMEIVGHARAVEVELEVADIGPHTDAGDVGATVGAQGDAAQHAAITLLRDGVVLLRDVAALYGH